MIVHRNKPKLTFAFTTVILIALSVFVTQTNGTHPTTKASGPVTHQKHAGPVTLDWHMFAGCTYKVGQIHPAGCVPEIWSGIYPGDLKK